MAYMNQEMKKELAPAIKAVLKKYSVKASIAVRHYSELVVTIRESKFEIKADQKYMNHCFVNTHEGELREFITELHDSMIVGRVNENFDNCDWYVDIQFAA